jgi:hypothetical protein
VTKVVLGTNETSAWPHFGGSIWVRLQYLLGLERLGVECYWVDRLAPPDPRRNPHSVDYLVERFRRTAEDFGFEDRYCIVYDGGESHFGMSADDLSTLVGEADLLLNVSGHLPPDSALLGIPRRAYLDVDPGFTQIWAHQTDLDLSRHNIFFTIGQNVGRPDFAIDTMGVAWQATVPPVVLDRWPVCTDDRWTRIGTVADCRGSQDAIWDGEWYGGKREEFLGYLRVPVEAGREFELALLVGQDDYEDLGILGRNGWRILDPYACAGDPHSYQEFIQRSRAEFSVAKRGYVRSRSGWLSDRTASYLASGKPALVQSTGFEGSLPTGEGLLTFSTVQEAVDGVRRIEEDYAGQAAAARRIAEERLDSRVVLTSLLERSGL